MSAEFGTDLTLRPYAQLARRRTWRVVGLAVLGLAVSLAISFTEPKQYAASAQVLVQPSSGATALGATQQPVTPTDVQTTLRLVTSAPVTSAVRHALGSAPSVTAAEVAKTNVIAITAIAGSPAGAALTANTCARSFMADQQTVSANSLTQAEAPLRAQIKTIGRQVQQLHRRPGTGPEQTALVNQQAVLRERLSRVRVNSTAGTGGLELLTPARAPASPSSPKLTENGLLGLAAGLTWGLAAGVPAGEPRRRCGVQGGRRCGLQGGGGGVRRGQGARRGPDGVLLEEACARVSGRPLPAVPAQRNGSTAAHRGGSRSSR